MTAVFIVSLMLSVFFIFASSIKILGWQKTIFDTQLVFFEKYGLSRQIMFLVGCIELCGAVTILSSGMIGVMGAATLLVTSAGAICFHVRFDTWKDGIPAIVTLLLSSFVSYAKLNML
ncbi:DoxX family protein [Enterovibrio norvegicus]|uniref:DoxX family protein n=1 Tax=Enterovibrio norvegicus TaxID=188144 RepID=UPI00354FC7AD